MLPFLAALSILGQAETTAPRDEYLYLLSKFDTDGFAPRGAAGQGDFDGKGRAFPDDALPEGRRIELLSGRFGKVVFLRPPTEPGDRNLLSLRGQTIPVRTTRSFNLLLSLGAAHATGDSSAPGSYHGWIEFAFTDGTRARGPIGFSDWSGEAEYGEEVGIETGYSTPRAAGVRRTVVVSRGSAGSGGLSDGTKVRLWLQRTPIPQDKVIASITLPNLPAVKVAGLTLATREGVTPLRTSESPPPEPAPVAIFSEPDFPRSSSHLQVTAAGLQEALARYGIRSSLIGLDAMDDAGIYHPRRFPVTVFLDGNAFPLDAAAAIRRYRKAGGAMVHSGAPFTRPVERTPYGGWRLHPITNEYSGFAGDLALGVPPRSTSTSTRFWPSPELVSWGFGDLPWERYEMRTEFYAPVSFQGLDTRIEAPGVEVVPLVNVGSWTTRVAAIVRQTAGDFAGSLDVWTLTAPVWLDGKPQTRLHLQFLARAAAWCLKEKGHLDAGRWEEIAKPLAGVLADPEEAVPEPLPPTEAPFTLPRGPAVEGTVRWALVEGLSPEEKVMLASAQGLIHRAGKHAVYLADSSHEEGWLEELARRKLIEKAERIVPRELLALLPDRRAVLVDPDVFGSLNLATMVAAAEGVLVAYPGLVAEYGLEPAADLRGTFPDQAAMLEFAVEHLLPVLGGGRFAAVPPLAESWRLRDYLIANRVFTFWIPDEDETAPASSRAEADRIIRRLLARSPLLAPVLGVRSPRTPSYWAVEVLAARYGKWFLPAGDLNNLSLYQRLAPPEELREATPAPAVELEMGKVYIATSSDPVTRDAVALHELNFLQQSAREAARRSIRGNQALRLPRPTRPVVPAARTGGTGALPVVELGLARLLPAHTGSWFATRETSAPAGLLLPESLAAPCFASAFPSAREGALDALGAAIAREMATARASFVVAMPNPYFRGEEWKRCWRHVPGGAAVFHAFDAAESSARDPLTASYLDDGVPVFHDLGLSQIRNILTDDGMKTYRPVLPLLLYTSHSTLQQLQGSNLIGERVAVVRPEELAALARKLYSERRLETQVVVPAGAVWKYHDEGKDLGTEWRHPGYDDSRWPEGAAELGYGDASENRPEATLLSYGDDSTKKHISYYFRHTFELRERRAADLLVLDLLADDGAIVYLNGKEAFRFNMPAGEVTHTTTAPTAHGGSSEADWRRTAIAMSRLLDGRNTLAVEVHQSGGTSSDLSFDLRLTGYRRVPAAAGGDAAPPRDAEGAPAAEGR